MEICHNPFMLLNCSCPVKLVCESPWFHVQRARCAADLEVGIGNRKLREFCPPACSQPVYVLDAR